MTAYLDMTLVFVHFIHQPLQRFHALVLLIMPPSLEWLQCDCVRLQKLLLENFKGCTCNGDAFSDGVDSC